MVSSFHSCTDTERLDQKTVRLKYEKGHLTQKRFQISYHSPKEYQNQKVSSSSTSPNFNHHFSVNSLDWSRLLISQQVFQSIIYRIEMTSTWHLCQYIRIIPRGYMCVRYNNPLPVFCPQIYIMVSLVTVTENKSRPVSRRMLPVLRGTIRTESTSNPSNFLFVPK